MRDREPRIVTSADDDPWQSAQQERALATLWPLLGRHIAFHRRLVDLTANVKAALLLSQTIYWTRHGRDIVQTGGWFLKTTEQWQMETGLSAREQSAAREVLRELAILNEQRVGIPARLHFRLCVDQLGALLSDHIGRVSGPLDWADGAAVAELLGPSLAYHRRLAGIGGGVHAGLLLSRALHLTRLRVRRQLREWIGNSADVWTEQIGLTRYEQEIARRNLADAGVWEETRVGTPRRLFARIRLDCLLALLAGDESGDANRIVLPYSPECGVATINTRQKGETSMRDSHIHVSTKMPIQFRQYRPYSFDKTANLHIQGSTRGLVQQPPTRETIADLGITYSVTDRLSVSVNLPFSYNDRSSMYEHYGNAVLGNPGRNRFETKSSGIGDARLTANYWILDPLKHPKANVMLGLGVKLPTGNSNVKDLVHRRKADGSDYTLEKPVDQSIQLGDGAIGYNVEVQGYMLLGTKSLLYYNGFYLLSPQNVNETEQFASDKPI